MCVFVCVLLSGVDVFYFCYGSNFNFSMFDGVCGMCLMLFMLCVLCGFEFVFNVFGVLYVELVFVSVVVCEGVECYGVAYGITRDEWEYLVIMEGLYDVVDVDCDVYDG